MAQRSGEHESGLDVIQEHMLGALVRLGEEDPHKRRDYPTIHDEVRKHTQGKVDLELADLRKARPILQQQGLIADGGIGFTVTDQGRQAYYSVRRAPENRQPTRH